MNQKIKAVVGIIAIILLFILVSYFVKNNQEFVYNIIGDGFTGIIIYILITTIAIVIAPLSMVPLMPLASNMWGGFSAAIFNIIGWTLGSVIVFFISRKYGVPLIKKFVSLEKINKLESKIPKDNLFFSVVILRMIIPVDILSYALGLFSKINFKTYALATILGITPFAFVFSYLGLVDIYYQIIGFVFIGFMIIMIVKFYKKRYSK